MIYWSCYIIKTFVLWKFTNPFFWIINLSSYSNDDRALGLFGVFMYLCFIIPVVLAYQENKVTTPKQ